MEDEKEASFRKLIKKVEPDKPGADFTRAVMNRVQAESELDLAQEAALIQLLQAHTLVENPSAHFSRRVMNRVMVSHAKPMEPIISPQTWYMIAASLLVVVLFCLLGLPAKPAQHTLSDMDRFLSYVEGTLDALPISYLFTLFAVSTLMVTDYYLRRTLKATY